MIRALQHDAAPLRRPQVNLCLGQIVATPGAIEAPNRVSQHPALLLNRHQSGDWGELDPDDAAANDAAVEHGGRVLSAYALKDATRVWIITDAGHTVTTILLPSEY